MCEFLLFAEKFYSFLSHPKEADLYFENQKLSFPDRFFENRSLLLLPIRNNVEHIRE